VWSTSQIWREQQLALKCVWRSYALHCTVWPKPKLLQPIKLRYNLQNRILKLDGLDLARYNYGLKAPQLLSVNNGNNPYVITIYYGHEFCINYIQSGILRTLKGYYISLACFDIDFDQLALFVNVHTMVIFESNSMLGVNGFIFLELTGFVSVPIVADHKEDAIVVFEYHFELFVFFVVTRFGCSLFDNLSPGCSSVKIALVLFVHLCW